HAPPLPYRPALPDALPIFSEAESRFPAATGLGARRRGALRRRFFLAIEKPGPYSESSFECKREIFSSSGDAGRRRRRGAVDDRIDRKSRRLNSSHQIISYA